MQKAGFAGRRESCGCKLGRTEAADFLVVGKGEIDRVVQLRGRELRDEGECHRHETLHVAGATSINAIFADRRRERVAQPFLPRDGNHVGMSRQHQPTRRFRADAGDQVGLRAGRVGEHVCMDARSRQHVAHEIDQRTVRFRAHGVETDKAREEIENFRAWAGHGGRPRYPRLVQGRNCSRTIRSSRLCSWSNSRVRLFSVSSCTMTWRTSRISV